MTITIADLNALLTEYKDFKKHITEFYQSLSKVAQTKTGSKVPDFKDLLTVYQRIEGALTQWISELESAIARKPIETTDLQKIYKQYKHFLEISKNQHAYNIIPVKKFQELLQELEELQSSASGSDITKLIEQTQECITNYKQLEKGEIFGGYIVLSYFIRSLNSPSVVAVANPKTTLTAAETAVSNSSDASSPMIFSIALAEVLTATDQIYRVFSRNPFNQLQAISALIKLDNLANFYKTTPPALDQLKTTSIDNVFISRMLWAATTQYNTTVNRYNVCFTFLLTSPYKVSLDQILYFLKTGPVEQLNANLWHQIPISWMYPILLQRIHQVNAGGSREVVPFFDLYSILPQLIAKNDALPKSEFELKVGCSNCFSLLFNPKTQPAFYAGPATLTMQEYLLQNKNAAQTNIASNPATTDSATKKRPITVLFNNIPEQNDSPSPSAKRRPK